MRDGSEGYKTKRKFEDLQEIVDYISDILHCPVTLEDSEHHLLAYSRHDARTDAARIETIISRKVPKSVIYRLFKDGIISRLHKMDSPLRIEAVNDIGLGNRVAIAIRKKHEVLGYIWVVELDNSLTTLGMQLLKEASEIVKMLLMKRSVQIKKRDGGIHQIFLQLLSGGIQEEALKEKFNQYGLVPPEAIAVIVFEFNLQVNDSLKRQITNSLEINHSLSVLCSFFEEQELVLLMISPKGVLYESALAQFIKKVTKHLKERSQIQAIGCAGNIYENVIKAKESYEEAINVLQLKKQFPSELISVCRYEELGIFRYLPTIIASRQDGKDGVQYSPLKKLMTYDNKQQTELVKTLEAFLDHDCRVNDVAQVLHIHPNTLNYRIKRIEELTEIELQDPIVKMTLYIELKIKKIT